MKASESVRNRYVLVCFVKSENIFNCKYRHDSCEIKENNLFLTELRLKIYRPVLNLLSLFEKLQQ